VVAAYGDKARELTTDIPGWLHNLQGFENAKLIMPGIVALQTNKFTNYGTAAKEMETLNSQLTSHVSRLTNIPFIVICDDADFVSQTLSNFLWATFTRCNPSHDIYGIDNFTINKHWGCNGPLVFDARIKPHHAPAVEKDAVTEKNIERVFEKGGSLYGLL
jgi:4-hydroxy-3-polyprenylbenzoate decarboxylase